MLATLGGAALGIGTAVTVIQVDDAIEHWLGRKSDSESSTGGSWGILPDLSLTGIIAAAGVGYAVYRVTSKQ